MLPNVSVTTSLLRSEVMLYADDTTVNFADSSAQRVEEVLTEDLGRLASWIVQYGLRMNLWKTQFMSMSRRCREREANSLKVLVNEEELEMSEEVKYLGVIVNSNSIGGNTLIASGRNISLPYVSFTKSERLCHLN